MKPNPVTSLLLWSVALTCQLAWAEPLTPSGSAAGSIRYASQEFSPTPAGYLGLCSFNIKWLGHFKNRDNNALAAILKPCDAVVVQEMVAPPWDVTPEDDSGDVLKASQRSTDFVNAMKTVGFDGVWLRIL